MSPKTVLIVEDEPIIALSIELHLCALGHEVTTASSIGQALERIDYGGIDLCILDYDINGRKSTAVAEALHLRSIPFVVCSGGEVEMLSSLFDGILIVEKPFTEVDLESAITGTLHRPPIQ